MKGGGQISAPRASLSKSGMGGGGGWSNLVGAFVTQVRVCCSMLQCFAVWYSLYLQHGKEHTVTHRNTLQRHTSGLKCVALYCSLLQSVAVCCSLCVTHETEHGTHSVAACYILLQSVVVCCSLLQSFAVCCSLLQSIAVCCSLLQSIYTNKRCMAYISMSHGTHMSHTCISAASCM